MDKNAIKKFAVWARTELIARVSLKGVEYGITEDNIEAANADSVGGKVLTADEKKQRQALIAEINDKGYKQVMEEVAYTWFNRFSALRFMEVNGYLPSHVRVFTDEENNFKPQIITEAIHLDLDGLDMEKVYELKDAEKTEELYKYLLIVQCNALNKILPGMFQKIADYTELLLPDNLLREGSVIQQMIELIPEDDWKDAVQIIGWLYQYYNSEKKDDVFAALKKNVKITKENIPAATQLFTPDWIVRYMVENSLGRLWLEGHPEASEQLLPTEEEQSAYAAGNRDPEDAKWHYYLEEAEQEPEVQAQLAEIRKEYAALTPDQLKVIDPCSGSGHILAYMFDVLMKIYESYGYTTREAVASIVENNLYGLDIDDRAAQLAYFAVMMKARQYDRRFFSRGIQPHVYAIVESNHVDKFVLDYFCNGDMKLTAAMDTIISELHDAKEYGSILTVTQQDWFTLYNRFDEIIEDINLSREMALRELLPLVQVAETLAQAYDTVVTNPPYMGSNNMGEKLNGYVKNNYPDTKSDMSTVCMEKTLKMCNSNGMMAMINIPVWMFLTSYEKLRRKMISENTFLNMLHLGRGVFGSDFGTTAFVICKRYLRNHIGNYRRLFNKSVEVVTVETKEKWFFEMKGRYTADQNDYIKIPGVPIAYWASKSIYAAYEYSPLGDTVVPRHGLATSDNNRFLKLWFEINFKKESLIKKCDFTKKWFPMNKGGAYRKWYGNLEWVINYENDGEEIKKFAIELYKCSSRTIQNTQFYFKKAITWSALTSGALSFRWSDEGAIFGSGAHCAFADEKILLYALGLMNSKVNTAFLNIVSATMNKNVDDIRATPFIAPEDKIQVVDMLVKNCIKISREDWDSFELSWDFKKHPLIQNIDTIEKAYECWKRECDRRFFELKENEEKINKEFIEIYNLQDELVPNIENHEVSVRRADLKRDICSFISYAVGCMFGRYSLDADGLIYAGGEWDNSKYVSFVVNKNNIIPIGDDEYFENDIVSLFVEFVKTVYGQNTLDENLKFIANALGGKGQPKDIIRNYFLNDFFSYHCSMCSSSSSGKRPIYWLFDSGKKNGFKALIYMHRYQPDTIARIRTDYVHEQQARYRTAIADLEQRIASASTGERVKLNKKLITLQAQDTEIRIYEEKIHHLADQMISIDLDDGVKKNYAIFQDVLAKIK